MAEEQPPETPEPEAPAIDPAAPLPSLVTPHTPEDILRRLDAASRRGRMAGFHREPAPALFSVEAFASPFEYKLIATAVGGASTRLTFQRVMLKKIPLVFIAVIIFSIWPGVWMTHSMIVSWFDSYPRKEWVTWAWYMPLAVLPLPWVMWKWWKKSNLESYADSLNQIGKLAAELDAKVEG